MEEYDIDKFLTGYICREERQYALFLYNIFLMKKNDVCINEDMEKIIDKCLFDDNTERMKFSVEQVFYEATLLRDFRESQENTEDKKNFNRRLLKFCGTDPENINKDFLQYHLGAKAAKDISKQKNAKSKELLLAGIMMNAKPDIIVVYSNNGEKQARAIECKYLSGASKYKDMNGNETINQELVQECVMSFLFGRRKGYKESEPITGKFLPYSRDEIKRAAWKKEYESMFEKCISCNEPGLFKGIRNTGVIEANFSNESYLYKKLVKSVYEKGVK